MTNIELKKLRHADYGKKTTILQRKTLTGIRKCIDEVILIMGNFSRESYFYEEFDYLITGTNPLINVIIASVLDAMGKKTLVNTLRGQDNWNYPVCEDINFQKKISQYSDLNQHFLKYTDPKQRTQAFLENFFKNMSEKNLNTVFIVDNNIALTTNNLKLEKDHIFSAVEYEASNLLPKSEVYTNIFNIYYKFFQNRYNNWSWYKKSNLVKNINLWDKADHYAYYHLFIKNIIITSDYHPYINNEALKSIEYFTLYNNNQMDFFKWLDNLKSNLNH